MNVRFIDDDWSGPRHEIIDRILQVGDDHLLPKKGEVYEVIGYGYWDYYEFPDGTVLENVEAYEIDIEGSENYGSKLLFLKKRFETICDNTYDSLTPNHVMDDGTLCKEIQTYSSCTFQMPDLSGFDISIQNQIWNYKKHP